MFDRSSINLDCKKIQLLNLKDNENHKDYLQIKDQKDWDLYDLSLFLSKIHNTYGKNIEEHLVLKKLTDALFEQSKTFYYW